MDSDDSALNESSQIPGELDELFGGNPEPEIKDVDTAETSGDTGTESVEVGEDAPAVSKQHEETSDDTKAEVKKELTEGEKIGRAVRAERMKEREKARKQQEQLRKEYDDRIKALEEKLNGLNKKPETKFDDDPIGYIKEQTEKTQTELEQLRAERQQREQAEKERAEAERVYTETRNSIVQAEREFAGAYQDYYDALNFVRADAKTKIQAMPESWIDAQVNNAGALLQQVGVDPAMLNDTEAKVSALIAAQELQASQALISQGVNPAEYIYHAAKQMGFGQNPTDQVTTTEIEKKSEKPDKVDRIKEGMKHSTTLSGTTTTTEADDGLGEIDSVLQEVRKTYS